MSKKDIVAVVRKKESVEETVDKEKCEIMIKEVNIEEAFVSFENVMVSLNTLIFIMKIHTIYWDRLKIWNRTTKNETIWFKKNIFKKIWFKDYFYNKYA